MTADMSTWMGEISQRSTLDQELCVGNQPSGGGAHL